MTSPEDVGAALKLLAPAPRYRAAAQEDIEKSIFVIRILSVHMYDASHLSKSRRIATRRLLDALWRAQVAARLARLPVKLEDDIARCEKQLARPVRPQRRVAYKQSAAGQAAYNLISKFGDRKQLRATRRNAWHRLAAILYGDPQIDLFNHMRKCVPLFGLLVIMTPSKDESVATAE